MRKNFKTIEEMLDLFGDEAFYAIGLYEYSVTFQGKFNSSMIVRCQQDGYVASVNESGYLELKKDNVTITLTQ